MIFEEYKPNPLFEATSIIAGSVIGFLVSASIALVLLANYNLSLLTFSWLILLVAYFIGAIFIWLNAKYDRIDPPLVPKRYFQKFELFSMAIVSPAVMIYVVMAMV